MKTLWFGTVLLCGLTAAFALGCVPDESCVETATCLPDPVDDGIDGNVAERQAVIPSERPDGSLSGSHPELSDVSVAIDRSQFVDTESSPGDASVQSMDARSVLLCEGAPCEQSCPGGGQSCDGACPDYLTDSRNCGGCRRSCNGTCQAGVCCPAGQTNCGGTCFDLQTTGDHCGACETKCGAGRVCAAGQCATDCGSKTRCGADCVDLTSDVRHCGACEHPACATVARGAPKCMNGVCSMGCNDGKPLCGGQCPDYKTDPQNCGTCGKQCAACANGVCCAAGETVSNGICCPADKVNVGGVCCAMGQINCNGACVNALSDVNHCGSCGGICTKPLRGVAACVNGGCVTAKCDDLEPLCGNACCPTPPPNYLACDSTKRVCQPHIAHPISCLGRDVVGSWDFEDGTTQGWSVGSIDASHPHDTANGGHSKYALAVPLHSNGVGATASSFANTRVVFCEDAVELTGKSVTVSAWFDGESGLLDADDDLQTVPGRQWATVKLNIYHAYPYIDLVLEADAAATQVFIDDVVINP